MKREIVAGIVLGVACCLITVSILLFVISHKNTQQHSTSISQSSEFTQSTPLSPITTPVELPFGGRKVLPEYRLVAPYGSPAFRGLGSLGEQSLDDAVARAKTQAAAYQAFSEIPVIPTFEIIATVASAGVTDNNDYSQELDPASLLPWIERAASEKMYVLLDFQPGRSTFIDQVKLYEELLKYSHVGIALDPEWRLQTQQDRHLRKVGSVSVEEINQTSTWLADFVQENDLPQKVFMMHQFKLSMIQNRDKLQTDREELSYVIHMDGFGELGVKDDTWNNVIADLPSNTFMGWKNFYDEDKPTPTPEQTLTRDPKPYVITYQ